MGPAHSGDQRGEYRPAGDPEDVGQALLLVGDLQAGVLEYVPDPLPVAGALLDQVRAQPGEVAQLPHRCGRDEAGVQHPAFGEFGQPDRVELVGLGPARNVLHVPRVDRPHGQAAVLEQVEPRLPEHPGGLHHHQFHALAHQVIAQGEDLPGARPHRPGLLHPVIRVLRPGQAGAHHPGGLGHVDRRDPRQIPVLGPGQLDHVSMLIHRDSSRSGSPAAKARGHRP